MIGHCKHRVLDACKKLGRPCLFSKECFEPEEEEAPTNVPLTLDELREMDGEPVWCAEMECWGIVKVETVGHWANKPFLVGAWHTPTRGSAVNFECDVQMRGLTLYRRKPGED